MNRRKLTESTQQMCSKQMMRNRVFRITDHSSLKTRLRKRKQQRLRDTGSYFSTKRFPHNFKQRFKMLVLMCTIRILLHTYRATSLNLSTRVPSFPFSSSLWNCKLVLFAHDDVKMMRHSFGAGHGSYFVSPECR